MERRGHSMHRRAKIQICKCYWCFELSLITKSASIVHVVVWVLSLLLVWFLVRPKKDLLSLKALKATTLSPVVVAFPMYAVKGNQQPYCQQPRRRMEASSEAAILGCCWSSSRPKLWQYCDAVMHVCVSAIYLLYTIVNSYTVHCRPSRMTNKCCFNGFVTHLFLYLNYLI